MGVPAANSRQKDAAAAAAAMENLPFQDPIAAWDVRDVAKWLLALGLARVVKVCKEASTDGLTLLQIIEPQEKEERERLVDALGLRPEELARILRAGKAVRRRDILRCVACWGAEERRGEGAMSI